MGIHSEYEAAFRGKYDYLERWLSILVSYIREKLGVICLIFFAILMNFVKIYDEGFANLYYAAGVKSMMINWHNFFFVSFDPGGFISLDKPPLGFWLQVLSTNVFGFCGWALILPQATAGVVSVGVVYHLVNRHWGAKAGLLAGLTLAIMPISVAANRNNTIDSLLTMIVLLAAWAMLESVEKNNVKFLYVSMLIMGIGYNIKTLEAFLVLPALCLVYLIAAHDSLRRRLINLTGSLVLLLVVSLSWSVIVDLTPANNRPYVGSSETNSELELATGYNGLLHFLGKGVQVPGVDRNEKRTNSNGSEPMGGNKSDSGGPGASGMIPMPGGAGGDGTASGMASFTFETGNPGIFRLFQRQIGGQISWLLPLGLFGLVGASYQIWVGNLNNKRGKLASILLWGGWLVPQIVFFSIAVDYHRYYLVMMAPGLAALVGISLSELYNMCVTKERTCWLLPTVILVNLCVEAIIIFQFDEWRKWFLPLFGIVGAVSFSSLLNFVLRGKHIPKVVMVIVIASLFIPQIIWAITPIVYGGNSVLPYAGPDLNKQMAARAQRGMVAPPMTGANARLEEFLLNNRRGETFILAVGSANEASQIIIDTSQAVMAVGGFMGQENILSASEFEQFVKQRKVRYVLVSPIFARSQKELTTWITANGKAVSPELWEPSAEQYAQFNGNNEPMQQMRREQQLYDCAPKSE